MLSHHLRRKIYIPAPHHLSVSVDTQNTSLHRYLHQASFHQPLLDYMEAYGHVFCLLQHSLRIEILFCGLETTVVPRESKTNPG